MRQITILAVFLSACTAGDKSPGDTGSESSVTDRDSDGTPDADDCAPDDPTIHPSADETCNELDDDCDGEVDNNPIDGTTYYGDSDADGHYGEIDTISACALPSGYGETVEDCDDTNPAVHPGADEACDLIDSDCDGVLGIEESDADGDGFAACEECDDTNAGIHPDADERCNGIDDNCDGTTDEDASWYPDSDGDGYGDETASAVLFDCDDPPDGQVDDATDCDDSVAEVNPGAPEVCDPLDVDENCNGLSDDDDADASGKAEYAPDADGDGYGDESAIELWCDAPSALVDDTTDCDDDDASTYPGAPGLGDGLLDAPACDGGGGSLALSDFELLGENIYDQAGFNINTAGDVDGDGLDDLLVAAPVAGKVYLVLGSTLAASSSSSIDLGNADIQFIGEDIGDRAGTGVSTAGDVDGDGLDDLLIGAPYNTEAGAYAGKAYLILGSTLATTAVSAVNLSDADFEFVGEGTGNWAGQSVSTAGDVDGDGLDDLLVGAAGALADSGKTYLVLGSTLAASGTTSIDLRDADVQFIGTDGELSGFSVGTAGDLDGDGRTDLFVGAFRSDDGWAAPSAGRVYLVLGSTLSTTTSSYFDLADADFALVGENGGDWAGVSVSTAGDVNGDGLDDLLVGAPYNNDAAVRAGKAYLIYGSTLTASTSTSISLGSADFVLLGEHSNDEAGASVGTAGDVDRDGLQDLFVGAYRNSDSGSQAGKAYVVLGSTLADATSSSFDLQDADFAFTGENSGDWAGANVTSAGDVNGDGRKDLFVGAPGNFDETTPGTSYLLLNHL